MSWKLAELRWRHDIGLYESRWDKESDALPVERNKAIKAFEVRGGKTRNLSSSRCVANTTLAGQKNVGLGKPVMLASSAPRSSIEAATLQTSPSRPTRSRTLSSSSLVPLLRTTSNCSRDPSAPTSCFQKGDLERRQPAARSHSSFAFSRSSSEVHSPSFDRVQHIETDGNETLFLFDIDRGQLASHRSEELDHLLSYQVSGPNERHLGPIPLEVSQVTRFPGLEDLSDFRRDTLQTSVSEVVDNLLAFEGAVFDLLNPSNTNTTWSVHAAQHSSETHWPSTVSRHRSSSLLLPFGTMSEKGDPSSDAPRSVVSQNSVISEDITDTKPRTPKRRMTPIYNDYQTAVSMIRLGTPKLPSPTTHTAVDKHILKPMGEIADLPKTPNRRYSYSMTDVHRKLAESYNDLHFTLPTKGHTPKQSATTLLPPEQARRVSNPVFPLRGRDSNDDNERLIVQGEYLPAETEENLAGIGIEDRAQLRDMELAQVRSCTRGDPVSSQEIYASSADFDYTDDSKMNVPELVTTGSARTSGSAPTDTTISNIVDQYRAGPGGGTDNWYGSTDAVMPFKHAKADPGEGEEQSKPVNVSQSRAAADVGPPPSWPLPLPAPALPRRNPKRRYSSNMLSSVGGYGNTSGLLNTKLFDASATQITSSGVLGPISPSKVARRMKSSNSSNDLLSRSEADVGASDNGDGKTLDVTRLSHVSEESSGRSQNSGDSGWLNAVGYLGKQSQDGESPELSTGADDYDGVGEVSAVPTFHRVEPANEWHSGHRGAKNLFYPSGLSTRDVRRRGGVDLGGGTKFGSLDHILARQVDGDDETLDNVDTSDWETIHDSRSPNNIQYDDAAKEDLPVIESENFHSFSSLSLKKAPVSTWDPLSTNTPGYDRSEKELGTLLKSQKESTQNKQVGKVGRAGTNNLSVPKLSVKVGGSFSLPGFANPGSAQPLVHPHQTLHSSQVSKPQPAIQARYRHPVPLQPGHRHPFMGERPVLPVLPKTGATSSSDIMADQLYNHPNRHVESSSSVVVNSEVSVSAISEEEHNNRLRDERNRLIQAEINLYDPGRMRARRIFPEARLTVDRRVRQASLDPVFVATQRKIGLVFRWFSVMPIVYPFGGFAMLWDIARGGPYMNDAMLQTSRLFGNRVVAVFHPDDILWAQKAQEVVWRAALVVLAGCVIFLAWSLYTGLK